MPEKVVVPDDVLMALAGGPVVGTAEQALPLLTTDPDGQPRAMLVSRAEVSAVAAEVHVVLRPSTSRSNIERTGLASLLVVAGDVLHTLRLRGSRHVAEGALHAIAFAVVGAKADSVGIPLTAMGYTPTEALMAAEHWRASADLLVRLAARS